LELAGGKNGAAIRNVGGSRGRTPLIGKGYMLQTDSLASEEMNPEKSGARVVSVPLYYELIVRDGQYYSIDRWKSSFVWKTTTGYRVIR